MSDNDNNELWGVKIDTTALKDYTPASGRGPNALLNMDGDYPVTFVDAEPYSNDTMGIGLRVISTVRKPDPEAGGLLYKTVWLEGEWTNDRGSRPRIQDFHRLMASAGYSEDQIKAIGIETKTLRELADLIIGKNGFVRVRAKATDRGEVISEVSQFLTEEDVIAYKKAGRGRTPYDRASLLTRGANRPGRPNGMVGGPTGASTENDAKALFG